jgi:hypothetical protein
LFHGLPGLIDEIALDLPPPRAEIIHVPRREKSGALIGMFCYRKRR